MGKLRVRIGTDRSEMVGPGLTFSGQPQAFALVPLSADRAGAPLDPVLPFSSRRGASRVSGPMSEIDLGAVKERRAHVHRNPNERSRSARDPRSGTPGEDR